MADKLQEYSVLVHGIVHKMLLSERDADRYSAAGLIVPDEVAKPNKAATAEKK